MKGEARSSTSRLTIASQDGVGSPENDFSESTTNQKRASWGQAKTSEDQLVDMQRVVVKAHTWDLLPALGTPAGYS